MVQVKFYSKNHPANLLGTSEAYASMNEYKVVHGRFLRRDDVQSKREVVVLGHKVARELFRESAPVGSAVRIHGGAKSITFQVVGVMEKKGVLGFQDVDNQVIIPYTTAMRKLFGMTYLASITSQCSDAKNLDECSRQIKRTLRGQHHIRAGTADDFELASQEQMKQSLGQMTKLFALVLYSIAGISLVVGGIGIMNIMMVSVTERTREIGVRMAVGARRFDIMRQFLIEAAIISFLGGALGVMFGMVLTDLLKNVTEELLSPYHSTTAMVWALGMASIVGVVSGLYPALRASRLDPVEALRYE
jgi:putative ABC transport system permease protein